MSSSVAPKFYKPVFGNDNFMNGMASVEVVDIADFTNPAIKRTDVAMEQPRLSETA